MRRVVLIGFQSLMSIASFGFAAFSFVQARQPDVPSNVLWLVWVRVVSVFLIGVLFIVLASRNLLRIGKAYENREAAE